MKFDPSYSGLNMDRDIRMPKRMFEQKTAEKRKRILKKTENKFCNLCFFPGIVTKVISKT